MSIRYKLLVVWFIIALVYIMSPYGIIAAHALSAHTEASQELATLTINRAQKGAHTTIGNEPLRQSLMVNNTSNAIAHDVVIEDILHNPHGSSTNVERWELGDVYPGEKIVLGYNLGFNGGDTSGTYLLYTKTTGSNLAGLGTEQNGFITLSPAPSPYDFVPAPLTPRGSEPSVLRITHSTDSLMSNDEYLFPQQVLKTSTGSLAITREQLPTGLEALFARLVPTAEAAGNEFVSAVISAGVRSIKPMTLLVVALLLAALYLGDRHRRDRRTRERRTRIISNY